MTEESRCSRFPSSFTVTLHHSRRKYTNIDLPQIANEDNDADHAQTSREISFRGAVGNVPDIE
jgi:hypothetical protein